MDLMRKTVLMLLLILRMRRQALKNRLCYTGDRSSYKIIGCRAVLVKYILEDSQATENEIQHVQGQ